MSKSKKNKGKSRMIYDMVDFGIRILESGKLKLQKDCIISMDEISKDAIDNTIGSRLDALEDNSTVSAEETAILTVNGNCCNQMHCYKMLSRIGVEGTQTLVTILNRKQARKAFNFMNDGIIGTLLRTSNLGTIYNAIRDNWYDLLQKSEGMDCILYIPGITIIADEDLSRILDTQSHKVNLLVYVGKAKQCTYDTDDTFMDGGFDEDDDDAKRIQEIVHGVLESAVRLNCNDLIIDPLDTKLFMKDVYLTAKIWHKEIEESRFTNHLKTIDFCIPDDDYFIIFWKSKRMRQRM